MLAGPNARGKRAGADAAGRAMKHGTVRRVASAEVPALHAALKTFALAHAGDVHKFADLESVHEHAIAGLGFVLRIFNADFAHVTQRRHAGLLEMPGLRLVHALRLDEFNQAELHRVVTVFIFRAPLHHHARARLQNRARHRRAVIGEDLRHSQFDSEYAVHCHFVYFLVSGYFAACSRPKALISTSTPGGRSSFISASTVSGVGSRMSMSRLCVRISNCSRDFLSTCGERRTVQRLITVGSGIGPATSAPVRLAVSTISRVD